MAKKQFRGVIAFDFDVDQENYKMFGELETQLEAHMALFAKRLAKGDMDGEFQLSKHVTVENPQSHFRDRRGPTGPIEQMVFRGGRGENTKISGAQMDRLEEMGLRLLQGMGLGHEDRKRYLALCKKAKDQGVDLNLPELTSENMALPNNRISGQSWDKKINSKHMRILKSLVRSLDVDLKKVTFVDFINDKKYDEIVNFFHKMNLGSREAEELLEDLPHLLKFG